MLIRELLVQHNINVEDPLMVDMSEDLDKKCCLMDEENDNDWEKLDNSSSVSEISLEEFARAIEKSSMKNENKIN
jgi:hypothetical protein